MANQEHVDRLKQGVLLWNSWRRRKHTANIDLRNANLTFANLTFANLSSADLSNANLVGTNLSSANLSNANLVGTNLSSADLSNANLVGTDLSSADLSMVRFSNADLSNADLSNADLTDASLYNANLCGANLRNTDLSGATLKGSTLSEKTQIDDKWRLIWKIVNEGAEDADLSGVDLSDADLSNANLRGADLSDADLYNANLYKTDLRRANLRNTNLRTEHSFENPLLDAKWRLVWEVINKSTNGVNLSSADLSSVNLSEVNLSNANLQGANLSNANLTAIQALGTNFQSATLTGTCIEDWNINSRTNLQEVICEYVFTKYDREKKQFTDRHPHDPNQIFAPGEFTKRYQIVLETVDLFFNDGIDWKALLASLQDLQSQYGNELGIQGIEKKAGGSFVVRLEVPSDTDKGAIERQAKELYETKLQILEAKYHAELQAKDKEIESYRRENANMMEIAKLLASKPITVEAKAVAESQSKNMNYNLQGSKFGGGFAAEGGTQIGGTLNDFSINIDNNINDITRLIASLRQLAQTFPTPQQDEAIDHLNDLHDDLQQPPEKRKPSRIKATLAALLALSVGIGGAVATATDFTNNLLELSDKLKIELIQPQTQQPNSIDVRAIEPNP